MDEYSGSEKNWFNPVYLPGNEAGETWLSAQHNNHQLAHGYCIAVLMFLSIAWSFPPPL
jgi:hypothetical protein